MQFHKGPQPLRRLCSTVLGGLLLAAFTQGFTHSQVPSVSAFASNRSETSVHNVYVGGQSVGIRLKSTGIMVVGFQKVDSEESPAMLAGVKSGDVILRINGEHVDSIDGLKQWLTMHPNVGQVELSVRRNDSTKLIQFKPAGQNNGQLHLGLYVRDRTSGVGTLTFYDQTCHRFGALGHVITDADTGKPIHGRGDLYPSEVFGIVKGTSGKPGEKRGRFLNPPALIGAIDENTDYGIFGSMNQVPEHGMKLQPIAVAEPRQVHEGKAQLLTVLHGQQIEKYTVEIENTVSQDRPNTKSMVIHVVDPKLLAETGGIVQGMSGSPLLQDGRLIGAVTHVFVSDPTRGYGVYAAWMLREADDGPDEGDSEETLWQSAWNRASGVVFRTIGMSKYVVKQQSSTKSIS